MSRLSGLGMAAVQTATVQKEKKSAEKIKL